MLQLFIIDLTFVLAFMVMPTLGAALGVAFARIHGGKLPSLLRPFLLGTAFAGICTLLVAACPLVFGYLTDRVAHPHGLLIVGDGQHGIGPQIGTFVLRCFLNLLITMASLMIAADTAREKPTPEGRRSHRRFRVSLRSLFVTVAIVAVLFGGWRSLRHQAIHYHIETARAQAYWGSFGWYAYVDYHGELTRLSWSEREGDEGRDLVNDALLAEVCRNRKIEHLSLRATNITDQGLVHLKELTELDTLDLSCTKVTGAGVEKLKQALPNCKIEH